MGTSGGGFCLGVDLGGSLLRMGAVCADGALVGDLVAVPTGPEFAPDDLLRELPSLAARLRGRLGSAPAGLGLGIPGVVGQGPLTQCDNLPRFRGVDENALLEGVAGGCTAVENDARCFTLAEAHYGAGRGQRDVCGIPLGTGVGCGVMIGGRLHRGAAFQSGEVWSLAQRGEHLEHFLSGAGVVRGYLAAGGVAGDGVDAEAVERRARAGEPAALAAWRAFGDDLSALCQSIAALLDPAVIVIGGSLSTARDLFGPALAAGAAIRGARLCGAKLGAAAGVIGAAALLVDGA